MLCRLECDAGYVSDLPPKFSCTDGKYEPNLPNMFTCKVALALIVSNTGEMEVFSNDASSKCDQLYKPNLPVEGMVGHTINLLDDQLVIGANTVVREKNGTILGKKWTYLGLNDPRSGLLTNKWTGIHVVGQPAPRNHVSLVSGSILFYFGGDFKAQSFLHNGRRVNGEWSLFAFLQKEGKDGDAFEKFASHACSAKVEQNKFLVIGGTFTKPDGDEEVLGDVFEVDTIEKKVQTLGQINFNRTQHACAVISKSIIDGDGMKSYSKAILITGGVKKTDNPQTIVSEDELFVYDDKQSLIMENQMQNPRFKHNLVQLGDEVLVLGGQTKEEDMVQLIEKLNFEPRQTFLELVSGGSWTEHSKRLKLMSTSGTAVTSIPESAIECNREESSCKCGISREVERIIGGTVVRKTVFCLDMTLFLDAIASPSSYPCQ